MTNFTTDTEYSVIVPSEEVHLNGLLYIPKNASGLVLFVHGSGSSRFSVRNQQVAGVLNNAKIATLLFDLFTPEEDVIDSQTRQLRFDIKFLASRLINASKWCKQQKEFSSLAIGYFGASTGGGAALVAAATEPSIVDAVVSRGGRPDLAGVSLPYVQAPTLLIAGGHDEVVIQLNEEAFSKLNCIKKMEIIPGATHLFEEPGTLDEAARLAKNWFIRHLKTRVKRNPL
jgi:putative phosphoribosyl transferase